MNSLQSMLWPPDSPADVWLRVRTLVLESNLDGPLWFFKRDIPHPHDAGAVPSIGLPVGQDEDWRFPAEHDCRGIHVQGVSDSWMVRISPANPSGHGSAAWRDAC